MSETFELAHGDPRSRLVEKLRHQVGRYEACSPQDEITFSSGVPALDQLLDRSPLRYGMLTEWLSGLARSGAATLSLLCAREACRSGGALVVIDRQQAFYPPAAAAWGIDLDRLLVVRPRGASEELWATEQALRSPAVAALWATIDRLDSHAFRRLQLAAQAGRTLGLLLRPAYARGQPSWADVQLEVSPLSAVRRPLVLYHGPRTTDHGRFIQVRLLRLRGGRAGNKTLLEIDDAAHTIHEVHHDTLPLPVVSQLADPAPVPLPARA